MNSFELHQGDCLATLRGMADNSVDSIVTDPPYGLSFMGKKWDYDVPGVDVWAECLRVIKPGGHLLAFAGTRTQHRMAVRIEDAGFEIRDMIAWVYGSGFPKSHNGEWGGTALKPALEPITMARKPLVGTVASNVLEWGTGALNVDGCRVEPEEIRMRGDGMSSLGVMHDDAWAPSSLSRKPVAGRWPANLITDGSEEVVAGFPQTAGTANGGKSERNSKNSEAYWGEGGGGFKGGRSTVAHGDTGSAARFFKQVEPEAEDLEAARFMYCAKASKRDRDEGLEGFEAVATGAMDGNSGRSGARTGGDGVTPVVAPVRANIHPTVKPTDLMAYLCRLVTPPGGTVLDPFMGSGSTGKAAMREGFRFIGCELSPEYLAIAQARIEHELARVTAANAPPPPAPQPDLFAV